MEEKNAPTIINLASGYAWRQSLRPAMFRSARFHVASGSRESGRRVVQHEFPKRDVPYGEDMGRKAREFTVRGYIIVYPKDEFANPLRRKNYIEPRDALIRALETEGPAILQLPLLGVLKVACTKYRVTEEEKYGGYCVFDMTFFEYGQAPAQGNRQSEPGVTYAADDLGNTIQNAIETGVDAAKAGVGAFTGFIKSFLP